MMGISSGVVEQPTIVQPVHDDLNVNANIQVADVDVGPANPVPVESVPTEITAHTFFDKTVTGSEDSASFGCEEFGECTMIVSVTATSGTNETLVPEVEISGDDAIWVHRRTIIDTETTGNLVRLTAPTVEGKILAPGIFNCQLVKNLGSYIRVGLTVGGANPSFTLTVKGYFR